MSDQSARPILGIDLGTTNSLAAVMGARGPRILRDRDGDALVPSVVCFRPDGPIVVGRAAKELALTHPDRTVHSIKRLIGRAGDEVDAEAAQLPYPVTRGARDLARVRVDGRDWSPEEISARVLAHVKEQAEAALGTTVEDAVVTVPAYFDDAQRQATKDAAELAGLRCQRIVNEPTAASLAYGLDGSNDGTVLVYDLGGGTFDVSILRIENGIFRVLATAGNTHLGGDDFDRALIERILDVLRESATDRSTATADSFVMQAVRASAEGLKFQLGDQDEARLEVDLGDRGAADVTVTRAAFEADIAPLVDETIACCRRALADAELTPDAIDHVLLVGGSTRVPLVRRTLTEFVGQEPRTDVDPDLAVALGAAVQADVLAGGQRDVLLLDVIPLSLGIETMGGVVSKLILRNATIPASVTEEFSTQVENQTAVDINIYQGERERTADCRKLGSFKLRGIPPMPAGLPRIAVTFLIDADGVLRVTAKEQRTGLEQSIQVVPSFGLTRDEVDRMMRESIDHAVEDMAAREGVELRNKARAMVDGTTKAIQMSDLPPDQTWSVKQATKKLAKLVDGGSLDDLREATEHLGKLTAQIADDVISSAVTKVLKDTDA